MAMSTWLTTISNSKNFIILALLFLSSIPASFSDRCNPNDKKVLLQIKKDLNNPYDLISWDPKTDCCDWYLVGCDDVTNRISNLDVFQADLKLPIPDAVGDLPYLQSLTFHHTNVTGQIPQAITKLSKLNFLDLRWNFLTGPVPSFLGQLKELNYIGLSFNGFTGSIPPSLGTLPKLGGLLLDRNKLTGPIPETFGDFKVDAFYLYLSHNQLSGPIPSSLGKANYSLVDVSRNKLEGDLSFFFQRKSILNSVDFSRNQFSFDMSKIKEFPRSLMNLDLNHNKVTGSLPKWLTRVGFGHFNVSYNRLCGKIPVGGRLQEFDYSVYFHNKCLCGAPLPPCK